MSVHDARHGGGLLDARASAWRLRSARQPAAGAPPGWGGVPASPHLP